MTTPDDELSKSDQERGGLPANGPKPDPEQREQEEKAPKPETGVPEQKKQEKDPPAPPDHAPGAQQTLRPSGPMGMGADREAFTERQSRLAAAVKPPPAQDEHRKERIERLRTQIEERKKEGFEEDRFAEREKGILSQHYSETIDKGGIER